MGIKQVTVLHDAINVHTRIDKNTGDPDPRYVARHLKGAVIKLDDTIVDVQRLLDLGAVKAGKDDSAADDGSPSTEGGPDTGIGDGKPLPDAPSQS